MWPQWWIFADVSQQVLNFSKKISKRKIIFWFDFHRCSHGPSKIRRHFKTKSHSILKLSKNVFYKKCGPKLIFFNEIFFRKIQTFSDIEKWLWKSEFCCFWGYLREETLYTSDEPELEFSGSSRAELWRFRAEPSWGTLISELKPSWPYVHH